ncbi:MAG: GNAT family N-acetyltransferase [Candidatus Latescibacteria bacterium]|nr:GNAT family N-acetyltransferase [Candidatus Latescibacterota bacterium]
MPLELPLHTPRLLLRDFVEADWEAVQAYAHLPEVVRYMPWGPNSETDTRDFIGRALAAQAVSPRLNFELALIWRESGQLIGGCGLTVQNTTHRVGEIGYCLHPDFWGRGCAAEAAGALLALGFEELQLHRIQASCDPENAGSRRVLEKIGMQLEGQLRQNLQLRGQWRDSLLWSILEHEWRGSG